MCSFGTPEGGEKTFFALRAWPGLARKLKNFIVHEIALAGRGRESVTEREKQIKPELVENPPCARVPQRLSQWW